MKIAIASKNNTKIEGAKKAFDEFFENITIDGYEIDSNVSEQPVNEEIYIGAKNRIINLKKKLEIEKNDYDYLLAIESGITNQLGEWIVTNVAIIEDKNGNTSFGTSSGFPVPKKYIKEIVDTSLGNVSAKVFGENDIGKKSGTIGMITNNKITRKDLTYQAFVMALTKFTNEDKWCD